MTWDEETAQWYADTYGEYATNRLAVDAIDVAPDAAIVDVGCGTGAALRWVAARVPSGTLCGLDPTPRMVAIARERALVHPEGHRITFHEAPAERLPLEDASADVVFAFDVVDHWLDVAAGLAEVRRVLRPGGRLVVVKDGGLAGGGKPALVQALAQARFEVDEEKALAEGEVSCTMWVCS